MSGTVEASLSTQPATRRFVRADGPAKVTGSGRYTADLELPGLVHAAFRFAGVSSARIVSIDTTTARSIPGVLAIITADDVPDVLYSYGVADRRLFARDHVRYEGEVIAAVAAISPAAARVAADAIEVTLESLPVVNDIEAALEPDSPLIHPDWESYHTDDGIVRDGNLACFSSIERGEADTAMAQAAHTITSRYVADGSHAVPIEPRAVVAQWEGDKVTIWSSTQVPFEARAGVCETLQLPTNRVRIIVPHLGGGFGGKCGFHYEPHVAALAAAAGRPVKLVFTRTEEFMAPDRRREGMVVELTTGLDLDGRILARTGRVLMDCGAYMADGAFFPQLAAMHAIGPYRIDNVAVEASLVYTNRQPSGSVRAPTAPQACWAVESHTDELAAAAGLDPVEFRRLNAVDSNTVGPTGQAYDQIGLQACIDSATAAVGYGQDLPANESIGVAIGWWPTFVSPAGAWVKVDEDGAVQVITGAQECGTGAVMTLRQLAADELGIDPERIELIYQDTAAAPFGPGASGSQTLINHGRAVVAAAAEVAAQLRDLAADRLEAAAGDIVLSGGQAHVTGSPAASVTIDELAADAADGELLLGRGSAAMLPTPETVGTTCVGDQGMAAWVAPQFSCHAVRVRLDPDTGVSRVLEVGAAHDSGTILNHTGALGQVHGAVLMGIGQALTEGTVHDDEGRQANAALLEYKLQTIADAPIIHTEFIEPPTANAGPSGAKGLAEAPNVPTPAAVANALAKQIGKPPDQLPMTAERIWEAMVESGGGR